MAHSRSEPGQLVVAKVISATHAVNVFHVWFRDSGAFHQGNEQPFLKDAIEGLRAAHHYRCVGAVEDLPATLLRIFDGYLVRHVPQRLEHREWGRRHEAALTHD